MFFCKIRFCFALLFSMGRFVSHFYIEVNARSWCIIQCNAQMYKFLNAAYLLWSKIHNNIFCPPIVKAYLLTIRTKWVLKSICSFNKLHHCMRVFKTRNGQSRIWAKERCKLLQIINSCLALPSVCRTFIYMFFGRLLWDTGIHKHLNGH